MSDTVFVDGLRVYKPTDRAPEWVVANLSIEADKLAAWLAEQTADGRGQVRAVICRSAKSGNYYAKLDTYRPTGESDQRTATATPAPAAPDNAAAKPEVADDGNLPF